MSSERTELDVENMICNGCESTIQRELRTYDDVNDASANHIRGNVDVLGDADPDEIADIIEDLGFSVNR